jgi:hypothetical protein
MLKLEPQKIISDCQFINDFLEFLHQAIYCREFSSHNFLYNIFPELRHGLLRPDVYEVLKNVVAISIFYAS